MSTIATEAIEADGMKHCTVGDRLLEYADCGPADGRPILMLHGAGCTGHFYKHPEFESIFEQRGVRVIAPSFASHGLSDPPSATGLDLVQASADDCLSVMEHAGISEPFMLSAWSLGGFAALSLLASHPERVRAALLTSCTAPVDVPGTPPELVKFAQVLNSSAGYMLMYMRAGMPLSARTKNAPPEMQVAAASLEERYPDHYARFNEV